MDENEPRKKIGRPKLSNSARKRSKSASNARYRKLQKVITSSMKLPVSVIQRWRSKAMELGISNADLARLLLDMHTQKSDVQSSVPLPTFGPQATSTPHVVGTAGNIQGYSSESSNVSVISGVAPLQSTSPTEKRYIQADEAEGTEEELDISVDYKLEGEFVYLDDPEDEADIYSDDLWEPVVSIRRGKSCVGLDYISTGEEVFGHGDDMEPVGEMPDNESFTRSGLHKVIKDATGLENSKFYIISQTRLVDLALKACASCSVCDLPVRVDITSSGTSPHISWICKEGHSARFCGQELLHNSHIGDLQLSSALCISGNNFSKIELMFRFMNLANIHVKTYNAIEKKYVCPAVEEKTEILLKQTRDKHRGKPLTVLGDGRNDSPGHCAQYLTYTMMENDSKDVLHVEIMDKREAGMVSGRMEPKALMKGLEHLKDDDMDVTELVTDAHSVVTSKMRSFPEIKHSYDIWHGAKNLGKKISKASLKAANRPLTYWQDHATNHFWHCAKTCNGSAEVFKQKWRGILHHVTNKHEWTLGGGSSSPCCDHEELPPCDNYLIAGSPPHVALANIVMDEQFIRKIPFYTNFRHTGDLESLNSHILMYASKRFSFGFIGYRTRNLLAILDYMHHKDRPVKKGADGKDRYVAKWSKKACEYSAVKVRAPKTYDYVPSLMAKVLANRQDDMRPLHELHVMRDDDPRKIQARLASKPPPTIDDILQRRHTSRF